MKTFCDFQESLSDARKVAPYCPENILVETVTALSGLDRSAEPDPDQIEFYIREQMRMNFYL